MIVQTGIAFRLILTAFILFTQKGFAFTNHELRQQRNTTPARQTILLKGQTVELDGDENLKALFERAVVLQRSGSTSEALVFYERFIKAAHHTNVEPQKYAEVYVNMGAIEIKSKNREMAKHYFKEALKHRKIGTAYVNLALLSLQEGSQSIDPRVGMKALTEAKELCQQATDLNDDPQAIKMATKLLKDIDTMLEQMKR